MRRLLALVVLALAVGGCSIIKTPTGPEYRYSWTMLHDYQAEGIQVGPKFDAADAADATHPNHDAHWSVYWWVGCDETYRNCAAHDYVLGDRLDPNVLHWYAIFECEPGVYCPTVDGKIVARIPLPYPPPYREANSELTAS